MQNWEMVKRLELKCCVRNTNRELPRRLSIAVANVFNLLRVCMAKLYNTKFSTQTMGLR